MKRFPKVILLILMIILTFFIYTSVTKTAEDEYLVVTKNLVVDNILYEVEMIEVNNYYYIELDYFASLFDKSVEKNQVTNEITVKESNADLKPQSLNNTNVDTAESCYMIHEINGEKWKIQGYEVDGKEYYEISTMEDIFGYESIYSQYDYIVAETPEYQENKDYKALAKQTFDLINAEREKAGLQPLTYNPELATVAEAKAEDFVVNNYFEHNSPKYGTPFEMMSQFGIEYSLAGENLVKGHSMFTPYEAVDAWMNSEGHKENILNPNFKETGIAVLNSGESTYYVQMFITE